MTLPLSPEAVEAAQESIADYMAAQDYAKLRASEMAALAIDAFLQVEGFEVEGKYAVRARGQRAGQAHSSPPSEPVGSRCLSRGLGRWNAAR